MAFENVKNISEIYRTVKSSLNYWFILKLEAECSGFNLTNGNSMLFFFMIDHIVEIGLELDFYTN